MSGFKKLWHDAIREPRIGVMLHFDASRGTDDNALSWFRHPDAQGAYQWLIYDDGSRHPIAPRNSRAWHAGECRTSDSRLQYKDANSAFYGAAWAGGGNKGDKAPEAAVAEMVRICVELFRAHGWTHREVWRITSHHLEAWPRGRKQDVLGADPRNPVIDLFEVRIQVWEGLNGPIAIDPKMAGGIRCYETDLMRWVRVA